jgi:hypothetical protein
VNRKNVYLALCILGAVVPYSQFIPWLIENGFNASLFLHQLFANRISAFFAWDVLISALVVVGFVRSEGKRSGVQLVWLPILGVLTVGVSFGFPLFLYLRERVLVGTRAVPVNS